MGELSRCCSTTGSRLFEIGSALRHMRRPPLTLAASLTAPRPASRIPREYMTATPAAHRSCGLARQVDGIGTTRVLLPNLQSFAGIRFASALDHPFRIFTVLFRRGFQNRKRGRPPTMPPNRDRQADPPLRSGSGSAPKSWRWFRAGQFRHRCVTLCPWPSSIHT